MLAPKLKRMFHSIYQSPKYFLLRILGLALFSVTGFSHFYVAKQEWSYSGTFLVFDHIYNISLVFLLLYLCSSIGLLLLCRWRQLFAEPLEILLFSSAVGIGVVATLILFLGVVSLLSPPAIGILFLALVFFSRNHLKEVILLISRSGIYLKDHCNPINLLLFCMVALFLICLASPPPIDWDSLVYHVQAPALFLKAEKIFVPFDNLQVSVVQLVHMLYIPLLAYGGSSCPALLSTFIALLMGLAVFEFCNRLLNKDVAGSSLILSYASTIIIIVCITPRVDVTVAFFLFVAHHILVKSYLDSSSELFYLAAIVFGFALGVKFSAGLYILALSPLIIWTSYSTCRNWARSLKSLSFFSLLFLCAVSPWLLKNWVLLKSPFYPFFTGRQLSPWVHTISTLRSVIDPGIYQASFHIGSFFYLKDFFLSPGRLMVEPEGAFYFANFIFLFLPLCVFFLKDRIVLWMGLPSLLFGISLNSFWPHSNLRYLIPALPILTILAVYAVWRTGARFLSSKQNKVLLIVLTTIIMLPNIGMLFLFWPSNHMALKYFVGMCSREDYLLNHPMPVASTYADISSYVNHNLSRDNKVLLIFEARGYHFEIPVIQDTDGVNWPLVSKNSFNQALWRSSGISHLLVNFGNFNYLVNRGLNAGLFQWEKFLAFANTGLDPIYSNKAYVLYKIKDPLPDPG